MSIDLLKNVDYLYDCYLVQFFPAIATNSDAGSSEVSWVNCPAFYSIKDLVFKIGSQNLFSIEGMAMFLASEFAGKLDCYADMIGFCKTRKQLINQSKYDRTLFAPLAGLPFQDQTQTAFNLGSLAFHGLKLCINSRQLPEMIVDYSSVTTKKGFYALPKQVSTNQPIQANAVQFAFASGCVWTSKAERAKLTNAYHETIFREMLKIGEFQIAASATNQRQVKELNVKGPVAYIAVTIRKKDDIDAGRWLKDCQDNGLDWVKELMIITGSVALEDGLPAPFYRTAKIVSAFKRGIDRHTYLFSFETNGNSTQMTGHRNLTNSEGVKLSALYAPSSSILEVEVYASVYNAWYTENGTGGKIFA